LEEEMTDAVTPPGVDPNTPSPARLYDYYLGGEHNFPADREAGEKIRAAMPELEDAAWVNRGFLGRAARWLAAERGIRQFIDIGAGLPTQNNTHEVVHKVAPDARVVYVDHDPEVEQYARPLVSDVPTVRVITADLRDPDEVLRHPGTQEVIDFTQPVGLLLVAVVHFVADKSDPWALVAEYRDRLAPGSYLAISHITDDNQPPKPVQAIRDVYANATENITFRTRADVERLFIGWELVPPYEGAEAKVTWIGYWGAEDPAAADSDGSRWSYAGVAKKPGGPG
jgi:SAM-dependent methyltransferase